MALYIFLFFIVLVIAGFIWVRFNKRSHDKAPLETRDTPPQATAPKKEQKIETAEKASPPPLAKNKTTQSKPITKPATLHEATAPPAKKKKARFSPSSPVIKQYETALNLQMIQAEKAGDEEAYIEIVKQNAVYMQACAMLQKGMNAKDREQVKASLIKIRGLIPSSFKAQHLEKNG